MAALTLQPRRPTLVARLLKKCRQQPSNRGVLFIRSSRASGAKISGTVDGYHFQIDEGSEQLRSYHLISIAYIPRWKILTIFVKVLGATKSKINLCERRNGKIYKNRKREKSNFDISWRKSRGSIKLSGSLAALDQSGHVALPWGITKIILNVREFLPIIRLVFAYKVLYYRHYLYRLDSAGFFFLAAYLRALNQHRNS
jgi:hypothetical protein